MIIVGILIYFRRVPQIGRKNQGDSYKITIFKNRERYNMNENESKESLTINIKI